MSDILTIRTPDIRTPDLDFTKLPRGTMIKFAPGQENAGCRTVFLERLIKYRFDGKEYIGSADRFVKV